MKNINNQRGQALVEFAIVVPLLLLIVMGIIQFSMIFHSYLAMQNASREGARIGVMGASNSQITNLIISTSPSLDAKNITVNITPSETNRKSGDTLTVKVTYKYPLTIPIINSMFNKVMTLEAQTSMRIE